MNKLALEKVLHGEIPLTKAMGISVKEISEDSVSLIAELDKNINHKSTAFGGSLYTVCVLAGWSILYYKLHALGIHAHIVIQEGQIQYLLPVKTDIESTCAIHDLSAYRRAMDIFQRKGKARFELNTSVYQGDKLAVIFKGKYVIHI